MLVKLSHLPRVCNAAKQRQSVLGRDRWTLDDMNLTAKVNCRWLPRRHAQSFSPLSDNERQQVSHVVLADGVHSGLTTNQPPPPTALLPCEMLQHQANGRKVRLLIGSIGNNVECL